MNSRDVLQQALDALEHGWIESGDQIATDIRTRLEKEPEPWGYHYQDQKHPDYPMYGPEKDTDPKVTNIPLYRLEDV